MKHYNSVKILSKFQNVKYPCENLSPNSRLSGDSSYFNSTSFHAIVQLHSILTSLKSKKHANSEQLKALEGFLQALEKSANWALLSSFCDVSNLRISIFKELHSTGVINKESITDFYPLLISPGELSYANREPNSYNHLGAFYVRCFARVCQIFTAVVRELQRGPYVVL